MPTALIDIEAYLKVMLKRKSFIITAIGLISLSAIGLVAIFAKDSAAAGPWCHNFNTNLGVGSRGEEVQDLLAALNRSDVWNGESGCQGDDPCMTFDEGVASAVVEFQEKYAAEILKPSGLKRGTGYVGPSTRAKLNKLYGCKATGPSKSVADMATQLVESYLTTYLSASKSNWERLLDYKINKIEVIKDEGTCFRLSAIFSVKPVSGSGLWSAHGNMSSKGWIENASLGFDATKQANGSYVLGQGYTGAPGVSCKTEKTVKVITPNGGETLISGNSGNVTIKWKSIGIDKVDIRLIDYDYVTSTSKPIAENITASNGIYYWSSSSVADILDNNFKAGDKFRIVIAEKKTDGTFGVQDQSDGFVYIDSKARAITVDSPSANQTIKSPVLITGKAVAFEGQFNIRIKDGNGIILYNANTMGASSYGEPKPFSAKIVYNTPTAKNGTVEVFEESAKDGSEINKVTVPVSFGDYKSKSIIDLYPGKLTTEPTSFRVQVCNRGQERPAAVSVRTTANGITLPATGIGYMSGDQVPWPGYCGISRYDYSWFNMTAGNKYQIKVEVDLSEDVAETNESNNEKEYDLTVPGAKISLITPNGGEQIAKGSTYNITWNGVGLSDKVVIMVYKNGYFFNYAATPALAVPNTGQYLWTVTDDYPVGGSYGIMIYDQGDPTLADVSASMFEIVVD